MKVIKENAILMPVVAEQLRDGLEVTIRAKGRSMYPYIRDASDSLVLVKDPSWQPAVDDIVLALVHTGMYVVHRVIEVTPQRIVLKGDGNVWGTEHCRQQDVCGRLVYIERQGRRIDCNTPQQIRKARRLRALYRPYLKARAFLAKVYHKIKH